MDNQEKKIEKEKKIEEIKRLCAENGLPVAEVFREAKIPYSTVQNWERKEPDAFETYDKLKETIAEMAKKQTAE